MKLSGKEITDYLEYSYSKWVRTMKSENGTMLNFRPDVSKQMDAWSRLAAPSYNFDSAAGIIYTIDLRKPFGNKVTIKELTNGESFSLEKEYEVAINSYRGNGGGDLLTVGAGIPRDSLASRVVWATDKDLRFYLMQEIINLKEINAKPLNQWKFIPQEWVEKAKKRDSKILFDEK